MAIPYSPKYSLISNKLTIEQDRSGYPTIFGVIESYQTIVLPTLTALPGVTLVLLGGPIFTQSCHPPLRGATLEVVIGPTEVSIAYLSNIY